MKASVDTTVHAHLANDRVREAVSLAIETYGPELLGYVVALEREHDAHEIFSAFCEDVVRGLAGFEGRASLRTWLYLVLRNARARHHRKKAPQHVPISRFASQLVERARSTTAPFRKTTVKDAYRRLREQLDPEDQEMLILRVDRALSWLEVARILGAGEDDEKRRAAALRKRFERVKLQLARLAAEADLR
ncbi:MAG: sigma factor [Deltaproteobacteria bacterium]|jgi:RNA polymerase sigma-70 factor (ECF subfamily)